MSKSMTDIEISDINVKIRPAKFDYWQFPFQKHHSCWVIHMLCNNCKGKRNDDFVECARCSVHVTRKQIHHQYTTYKALKDT